MFTNKHVVIALIVGPILAILAWIGVGQIAGEEAAAAVSGKSYPLVEKSDCRYESGHCKLENEDFKLILRLEQRDIGAVLVLKSVHPLEGVMMSVAESGGETSPSAMRARDAQNMEWVIPIKELPTPAQRLYLVASSRGVQYFGDVATLFIKRQK
ncbi:MAG: hypothetical protein ACI8QT_000688 [Halioglobus sp.]